MQTSGHGRAVLWLCIVALLVSTLFDVAAVEATNATAGASTSANASRTDAPFSGPVPSCADNCTNCAQRGPGFVSVDPACASCSRIQPELEGQTLGDCVLLGPQSAAPLNGPTAGGTIITLTGEYFGSSASAPGVTVKVGDTACAELLWLSRTSVSCKTPAGVGPVRISVATGVTGDGSWSGQCTKCGVGVNMPGTFSYDRPQLSSASQPAKGFNPPTGGFPVTLVGKGFGVFDSGDVTGVVSGFYGIDVQSGTSFWTSDSCIVVTAPPGVGQARPISLVVAGQSSACFAKGPSGKACGGSSGPAIDYDPPTVKRVRPALAPREGGRMVTLRGIGYGPQPTVAAGEGTADESGASQTEMLNASSAFAETMAPMNPTGNTSAPASLLTNATDARRANQATDSVGVMKSERGSAGDKVKGMAAKIGETRCIDTHWVSQTAAVCVTPPGDGAFVPVQIMVGNQWSPPSVLEDLWHSPTFSFVGSTQKVTALVSQTVQQYQDNGGHAHYANTLAARILTECISDESNAVCGGAFRGSQVMFTAEPISYERWCMGSPGCVLQAEDGAAGSRAGKVWGNRDDNPNPQTSEDQLLDLLRRRSGSDRRDAQQANEGSKDAADASHSEGRAGEEAEAADETLESLTVVEFKLLGSEVSPDSHAGALALLLHMGVNGNLWNIGIRAIKMQGSEWQIASRDCPRGDRYNDLPCMGRGRCVSGVCLCQPRYSGDRCETKGSFSQETLQSLGNITRVAAAGVLGLSAVAHLLAWVVSGGFMCTQVVTSGDHWSFLLHLQFIALTAFLDTSLPLQFYEWASYFRVFTLQIDPKYVVEALGMAWTDLLPWPLTDMCYTAPLPKYQPRAALLSNLAGGNATAMSAQTLPALSASVPPGAAAHRRLAFLGLPVAGDVGVPGGRRLVVVTAEELVKGWGGNVAYDADRGTLEVSFRMFCGTVIGCYCLLAAAYLVRRLLMNGFIWLRRRTRRWKLLKEYQILESNQWRYDRMTDEEQAQEVQKREMKMAAEIAARSDNTCHAMTAQETLGHARKLASSRTMSLTADVDKRVDTGSMKLVHNVTSVEEALEEMDDLCEDASASVRTESVYINASQFGAACSNVAHFDSGVAGTRNGQSRSRGTMVSWRDGAEACCADDAEGPCDSAEGWASEEQDFDWWEMEKTAYTFRREFENLAERALEAGLEACYARSAVFASKPEKALNGSRGSAGRRMRTGGGGGVDGVGVGGEGMTRVQVAGNRLGFGAMGDSEGVVYQGAAADKSGEAEGDGGAVQGTVADEFDANLVCAACRQVGHTHKKCPELEESLRDKRDWQAVAPADLLFPRWELPIMAFIIAGVSSSTAAVLSAASAAGCGMMYATAAALAPMVAFQVFVFWQVHVNVFSKNAIKVFWRANSYHDAAVEKRMLAESNWPKSKLKAKLDYYDALTTTGWWEEAVQLTVEKVTDDDGKEVIVKGGQWLSQARCERVVEVLCNEAMMVPALFLRSKAGMQAAADAQDLHAFFAKAKHKLDNVVLHVSSIEMRKLGVKEPAVVRNWASSATEALWPANEDCYRRAIYEGEQPDCVEIADSVRAMLTGALKNIKGMAKTEYADAHGKFAMQYRAIYKRYSGNSAWQVHYMSFQIAVRFFTAVIVGFFSGALQGALLAGINALNVAAVAGVIPYKNRLQNCKHLLQCTLRTFLLLLSFMMTPRAGLFETNEAANEATFVVVLLVGCGIDAVSPALGSVRSVLGSLCVLFRIHRSEFVMHNARVAAFVKFCMGQQRNRTALYLRSDGTNRSHKPWTLMRSRVRASKEERRARSQAEAMAEAAKISTVDQRTVAETCLEDVQDALALQKWLGVHILPRIIAIAASTSRTFCAFHLGSTEALEDLYRSNSLQEFLVMCKQHFFKQMSESILLVLPSPEQTEVLLTHPYTAKELENLRLSRQPRPPPPWFHPRTRKTARLLLTKVAWKVTAHSWQKVLLAIKGQVLTWKPGSCLDEEDRLLQVGPDFGIDERELHKLIDKIELPEVIIAMSKVLPDDVLEQLGGDAIENTPRSHKVFSQT